jgi:ATP-binding cassette subfamily F protein uup
MNFLSVENLRKAFGENVLFENLTFGIAKGQKVALIAQNGSGKTTLMQILMGIEDVSDGNFSFRKDVKVGFLPQNPDLDPQKSIIEVVLDADTPILRVIKSYEECLLKAESNEHNEADSNQLQEALLQMDNLKAWDYEQRIKQILTKLRVGELDKKVQTLSGGQKKRVALAKLLIEEPAFLLLDEPTNHLDLDMIEWLEEYLSNQQLTLLMVTHDRYFLERICNEIVELDKGILYKYTAPKGREGEAYSYFLEKKSERTQQTTTEVEKAQNLMRKELDWIRRQPKARGTKAKYRVEAFEVLKQEAQKETTEKELKLSVEVSRLGNKIIEFEKVSKSYGEVKLLDNFSYIFQKRERVGIIGRNGAGKSTFLNLLTGTVAPDRGEVAKGETIVFGYYTQDGLSLPEDKRVIEVVKDIAEHIPLSGGRTLSAGQMLERFLFTPKKQYTYISTLSGGERRRLYLLTILVKNPNFLILDEPTNDLDIVTLQVLEDFLADFGGCLVIVSHDRYFMDRLVSHLLIFEGEGKIRDFNGVYSEYRAVKELEEEEMKTKQAEKTKPQVQETYKPTEKKKLSAKEKKEYETLETEIEALEARKNELTTAMNAGTLSHTVLQTKALEFDQISALIDEKTLRWMELAEWI